MPARRRTGLAAAIATAVLALAPAPAAAQVKVGDRAASLRGAGTPSGTPVTWKKLRGKVVVLTFGASWCQPCRKELPALDRLAIDLIVKRGHRDLRFIAVNLDDERAAGERFMKGLKLDCVAPIYDPGGRLGASYRPRKMPTTYVVDRRGIVRHVHAGYQAGDETELRAAIRKLL